MRPFSRSTENSYAFTEEPPSWKLLFSIFTKVAGLESIIAVLLKIDLPTEFFSYVLFKVALFQHFGKCSVKYHFNIQCRCQCQCWCQCLNFQMATIKTPECLWHITDAILVSLLLFLCIFDTFFCFYCWLWTGVHLLNMFYNTLGKQSSGEFNLN